MCSSAQMFVHGSSPSQPPIRVMCVTFIHGKITFLVLYAYMCVPVSLLCWTRVCVCVCTCMCVYACMCVYVYICMMSQIPRRNLLQRTPPVCSRRILQFQCSHHTHTHPSECGSLLAICGMYVCMFALLVSCTHTHTQMQHPLSHYITCEHLWTSRVYYVILV